MGQEDDRRSGATSLLLVSGWWTLTLSLILLAWTLRLFRLGGPGFWYDEGYIVYLARLPLSEILPWTAADFTPPLYHCAQALWLRLAGASEFAVRFPSACAGLLTVAVVVRLGCDFDSRPAGLLAGLLATLSPFYVWYSQEARMYMPQAFFATSATLLLLRALRRPDRRRLWAGFALLDILALYTHIPSGFLLTFHALVIFLAGLPPQKRLARWGSGALALAAVGLALLPWLAYAWPFLAENAGYWPGRLTWQFVAQEAFAGFVTGSLLEGTPRDATVVLWAVAYLVGFLLLVLSRRERWKALFLLGYLVVPIAAMAWLFHNVPKFSPRHLIVSSPPLFLLPAFGVVRLFSAPRRLTAIAAALACLLLVALTATALLGLSNLYFNPAFAKTDFRAAAQTVRGEMAPGEVALIVPGHIFPAWAVYFGADDWLALPYDLLLDVTHVLHYRDTAAWMNEHLAGRSGVWLVEWDPRVVDPTDVVPYLLEQVSEEVAVSEQPNGLMLRHFRLRADTFPLPAEPQVQPPVEMTTSLPLQLKGCAFPAQFPADQALRLGCFWSAAGPLPAHLYVSARLLDQRGIEWGRADAPITSAALVTTRWPQGEWVLGQYAVSPFPGTPPGEFYQVELLVYEYGGARHGTVEVGPVSIGRPAAPFTETLPSALAPARLGNLVLESARITPAQTVPGSEVRVEAIWRVEGAFAEPYLLPQGTDSAVSLLPHPGATALWAPGERYRTITHVFIPPAVAGGATPILAVSADGSAVVGVVDVDVERSFALPADAQAVDYRLGDAIRLIAFAVEGDAAGGTLRLVLYWRAEATVETPYMVFVHLIGPDGQIHAQVDAWPQEWRHPTNHWLPGEVVADGYHLELPSWAPPGEYRLLVGMYDLTTMVRLPVTDASGNRLANEAILLRTYVRTND